MMHALPFITLPVALAGALYWHTQEEPGWCRFYLACALMSVPGVVLGLLL